MTIKKFTDNPELPATPYEAFRGTPAWETIDKAINDLVENGDIVETTRRDYIVGCICEKLQNEKVQ
jgi:hypothetical protein